MSAEYRSTAGAANWLRRLPSLTTPWAALLVAVYLMVAFNAVFFQKVLDIRGLSAARDVAFLVTVAVFLVAFFTLFLSLFAFPRIFKPVSIALILLSSLTFYFMSSYGVMIEKTMIQNVMETDFREGLELLNGGLLIHLLVFGAVPSLLLYLWPIRYSTLPHELLIKVGTAMAALGVIGLIAVGFYQDYASLFRNHRYVRDLIVPLNVLYSTQSYFKHLMPERDQPHQAIGLDAKHLASLPADGKPQVVVLVVGETARADHFSLNGYSRLTNPRLAQEEVINFTQVVSCGTTTAVSLPCMFSVLSREDFVSSDFLYRDNVLDVVQRAGIDVSWLDNNSGCKGACDRVTHLEFGPSSDPEFCNDKECLDEVVLKPLQARLQGATANQLIVVHQKGSHGPAYFQRVPKAFEVFTPVCRTVELQECTREEVVNAYDNSILYTDHVLAEIIQLLKAHVEMVDASMLYLSDHGESLGENNLYLHGIPYSLAPDSQKRIPMVAWFSPAFALDNGLDTACLNQITDLPWSQDNLFSTVLGLAQVSTDLYQTGMDLLSGCRPGIRSDIASQDDSSLISDKL